MLLCYPCNLQGLLLVIHTGIKLSPHELEGVAQFLQHNLVPLLDMALDSGGLELPGRKLAAACLLVRWCPPAVFFCVCRRCVLQKTFLMGSC